MQPTFPILEMSVKALKVIFFRAPDALTPDFRKKFGVLGLPISPCKVWAAFSAFRYF